MWLQPCGCQWRNIGRSEEYTTAEARDHGIQAVLCEGPEARVQDLIQQSS